MDELKLSDLNIYDFGNKIQISGIIWSGKGLVFITPAPDKKEDLSNPKLLPLTLEEWQRLLKQTDSLETEIFQKDPSGITKIILRKSQRQIDSYVQWKMFQRDNYTCRYCGRTGIPLSADHVDLWEDGGPSILENLLSSCRQDNKDRGRMKYEDWINSDIYKRKSKNLPDDIKALNLAVLDTLPSLRSQRIQHIRSR